MQTIFVAADAARAAGRVTFTLGLVAATIAVFVAFRRRRAHGDRAFGWLAALVVLGLLCLGAVAGAAQS